MFKDHKPLAFFSIIFAVLFAIGLIIGTPVLVEYYKTKYITKVPSAILATGVMTLAVIFGQCGVILHTIVKQHRENYELNLLRYEQIEKYYRELEDSKKENQNEKGRETNEKKNRKNSKNNKKKTK